MVESLVFAGVAGLEVGGIHAGCDTARVVDVMALRDLPHEERVGEPVGVLGLAPQVDDPVAVAVEASLPDPAASMVDGDSHRTMVLGVW